MTFGVVGVAAGIAAITCGAVSAASWRALLRTGYPAVGFFVVGFALLGLKNAVKSWASFADAPETGLLEGAFSLLDVAAAVLFAWPLLARRRGP